MRLSSLPRLVILLAIDWIAITAEETLPLFELVNFKVISEDVLLFEGNSGYGTLIKAPSIPAGNEAGTYDTDAIAGNNVSLAEEWLVSNFGANGSDGVFAEIPFDRLFDVQWNPPGHPALTTFSLRSAIGVPRYVDEGVYIFKKNEEEEWTLSLITNVTGSEPPTESAAPGRDRSSYLMIAFMALPAMIFTQ